MGTPLQDLLAGVPDPCVVLLPVEVDDAIVDFEFIDANGAACAYIGRCREELEGERLLDLFPVHRGTELFDRYVEVMRTGVALIADDMSLPQGGGPYRHFDILAARFGDYLVLRFRDRTVVHEQAERLAESERRYRHLAGQISDVVYECDANGTVLWVSPSVEDTLGWSADDMLGRPALDFVVPEDIEHVQVSRAAVLEDRRSVSGVDCRFSTKSGERRWVEVNARPLLDDNHVVTGSVVGLRDIQHEVLLRRAVNTLSAANSILVRAKSESDLLQQMCEVPVNDGGYLFAWYGRPLHDATLTVQPVAWSPGHRSYLDEVRVSWGDNEFGRGPTGLGIRTGTTQIMPDFASAKALAPWRDAAIRHGFQSSISLPVFVDGKVDGALTVYAPEMNGFDAQASGVMEDLAAQLGYGIARMRDAERLARALDERRLLVTAIDQAAEAILVTDTTPAIRYANPAAQRSSGYSLDELRGQDPRIFQSGLHDSHFYEEMWARLLGGRTWHGVLINRRKDGELFEEDASIAPVHDASGERIAYVAVKHDLTKERRLEAAVTRDQIDRHAIISVLRDVRAGDSLAATASSLCRAARGFEDIDSAMVILLRDDGVAVPVAVDGPLPQGQRLGAPLDLEQRDLIIDVSKAGPWWIDFRDPAGLGGAATSYIASMLEEGFIAAAYTPIRWEGDLVGVLSVATTSPTSRAWMPNRMPVLAELGSFAGMLLGPQAATHGRHEAHRRQIIDIVEHERFHVVFEPVVHLITGDTVGYEALTRFDAGGPPTRWFEMAHSVGLGSALEGACGRVAVTAAASLASAAWVSLNFSPSAIIDGTVAAVVRDAGRELVIEITEHNQIDNYAAVRRAIAACGGVRVAVDDTGAGFASLRHILELQPDILKLDLALVRDIDSDPARQALAAGLRHFASLTGTTLVAEGVETMAEANTVRDLGVDLAQGFLFSQLGDAAVVPLP